MSEKIDIVEATREIANKIYHMQGYGDWVYEGWYNSPSTSDKKKEWYYIAEKLINHIGGIKETQKVLDLIIKKL